jgi:hypothetical protein
MVTITGGDRWEAALRRVRDSARDLHAEIGVLEGATALKGDEYKGVTALEVGAFQEFGTSRIPARSFVRRAKEEHGREWAGFVKSYCLRKVGSLVLDPEAVFLKALEQAGRKAAADMKKYISESKLAPLSPKTVRRKLAWKKGKYAAQANIPLAFSGTLVKAIASEVKSGPS